MDSIDEKEHKMIYDVTYTAEFNVECKNILDDPKAMQFPGYEPFPIERLKNGEQKSDEMFILNTQRVRPNKTKILIILRYFEYLYIAQMNFSYLTEICKGDSKLIDVIDMVKHHLKNKLIRDTKTIEVFSEMYCSYIGKIQY